MNNTDENETFAERLLFYLRESRSRDMDKANKAAHFLALVKKYPNLFPSSLMKASNMRVITLWRVIYAIANFPWDKDLVDQVTIDLIHAEWVAVGEANTIEENRQYEFAYHHPQLPGIELDIVMNLNYETSKCEYAEVGEEEVVTKKKIYKVRCKEE